MQSSSDKKKTMVLYGDRISRAGELRLGCSAVLFDKTREKVLLTRRKDNGLWCLPGGMIDPGESVSEGCQREVWEETGLQVRVIRLTGVYSDPNRVTVYPDGNKTHVVALVFEVERTSGKLGSSEETTDARFFPVEEAVRMDLFHGHAEQLREAAAGQSAAFIH